MASCCKCLNHTGEGGCESEYLYDEDGELIPERNDEMTRHMLSDEECPCLRTE